MHETSVNRTRRLITFRASGTVTVDDLRGLIDEAKWATDGFRGEPHMVFADMRGMVPMSPEGTKLFVELVKYSRERGCILCAHLSDSSIARLQANRLAREASPYDDITVNVVSVEEAERVITEKLASLRLKVS